MQNDPRQQHRTVCTNVLSADMVVFSQFLIGHMGIHVHPSVVNATTDAYSTARPGICLLVLLYVIMRYMGYNVEPEHQLQAIDNIFFQHSTQHGESCGGAGKQEFMGNALSQSTIPDNDPLTNLM